MSDYDNMDGPNLVDAYNRMAVRAFELGLDPKWSTPVKRFTDRKTALRRCEALSLEIVNKAPKKSLTSGPSATISSPSVPVTSVRAIADDEEEMKREFEKLTIRQMTDVFNQMVPAAKKAGLKHAKHHTSNFGSREDGVAALLRMAKGLKKAGIEPRYSIAA